ncbi:MAG TPA: TRAP transporter small permease [Dehalococcoidales bacterium]|nr:TRAP transporter small permease [Dehalococcoidales bacterium]
MTCYCHPYAQVYLAEGFDVKTLNRAGVIFDRSIDYMLLAAAIIIVIDAIVVSVDVILRKSFGITWNLLYEMITYTLVWMTFLGTTSLMRSLGHVKMDSVTGRLSPKTRAIVNFITSCMCIILLAGIVFYTSRLTVFDYQNHFALATILNPPKWPIEIIIPIGFLMLFIQVIRNAYAYFNTYKTI